MTTMLRPTPLRLHDPHDHTRSCWWDVAACRWAGPDHPAVTHAPVPRTTDETAATVPADGC